MVMANSSEQQLLLDRDQSSQSVAAQPRSRPPSKGYISGLKGKAPASMPPDVHKPSGLLSRAKASVLDRAIAAAGRRFLSVISKDPHMPKGLKDWIIATHRTAPGSWLREGGP